MECVSFKTVEKKMKWRKLVQQKSGMGGGVCGNKTARKHFIFKTYF